MTEDLVHAFYEGLAARDAEAMVSCYADDVVFEDPAFGELHGDDAKAMWRMLCSSDTDLSVRHTILESGPTFAKVNWVADYTFTKTGRSVTNDIVADWTIADGLVVDHRDAFSFWAWSAQALGLPGQLLGWTPMMKSKVRATTRSNLDAFRSRSGNFEL